MNEHKVWSARELAEHTFELPTFLVEPIVPLGGLVLLHGKRGVGKTQFCFTLANAVTTGRPFLNRFPVRQGPVIKVQVDMTPQIQQLRIHKVHELLPLDHMYYFFPRTLNVTSLIAEDPFVLAVNRLKPLIIIWDTLRKIHRENENASESAQVVYNKVNDLFPDITHFFIHHDKKTVVEQAALDPEEAFRGTGDWIDSTDTSMQLVELKNKEPSRILLYFHKARTAPKMTRMTVLLELDPDTMLLQPYSSVNVATGGSLTTIDDYISAGACDRFRANLFDYAARA
jgi:hypothetical protein